MRDLPRQGGGEGVANSGDLVSQGQSRLDRARALRAAPGARKKRTASIYCEFLCAGNYSKGDACLLPFNPHTHVLLFSSVTD